MTSKVWTRPKTDTASARSSVGGLNKWLLWLTVLLLYLVPMHKLAWEVGFRIWLIDLVVAATVVLLIGSICLGYRPRLRQADVLALGLIIGISVLSVVVARDISMYFKLFASLVLNITVATLVMIVGRNIYSFRILFANWIGSGVLASLYAAIQWFFNSALNKDLDLLWLPLIGMNPRKSGMPALTAGIHRVTGLALDPNNFSSFLLLVAIPLLSWWLYMTFFSRPGWLRWWGTLIGSGLVILVDVLTISRSGLGGLFVGTLVVLWGYRKQFPLLRLHRRRGWYVSKSALSLMLTLVLISGFVMVGLVLPNREIIARTIQVRIMPLLAGGSPFSEPRRAMLNRASYDMVARSPLLGVGLGNYSVVLQQDYYPNLVGWGTHNGFLDILTTTGILGGLAYGLLFGLSLWRLWRLCRARIGFMSQVVGLGFLGALIAYMFANLFYQSFIFVHFWAFLGLALAASRAARREQHQATS